MSYPGLAKKREGEGAGEGEGKGQREGENITPTEVLDSLENTAFTIIHEG